MADLPIIPEYITVHLGPPDSPAENVTETFLDYIKGVASSQINPNWPENAIRADIYPMVSFALNRIYNNYYRSKGYNFDITNSPTYDQAYIYGGDTFSNISQIVDEQFNSYLVRPGSTEPFLAPYCDGTTVSCDGLSLWGSVELAEKGATPYQILTNYYGNDLNIVFDAPVSTNIQAYPGAPLAKNAFSRDVRRLQIMLNRLSTNYPSIPNIYPVDGMFGKSTEDSVKAFQTLFNLKPDGIVNNATWYRLAYLYNTLLRLSRFAAGINSLGGTENQFKGPLKEGQSGDNVKLLQLYLSFIGNYYDQVPIITEADGFFGPNTRDAVIAYQKYFGLNPDGVVGQDTWNSIYLTYLTIMNSNIGLSMDNVRLFPGTMLSMGATGPNVLEFEEYLSYVADTYTEIPKIPVTGYFGQRARDAVVAFQKLFGLNPTGIVDQITWNTLATEYSNLINVYKTNPGQYPGYILGEGV